MANYTRRDMQFCVSTFMWDIKSILGVLCATNVTRHATLQHSATRCSPQKSLSSGVSLHSQRNMDVGALKRKGDFLWVGRANSMQACIPHLLDQLNQIVGIGGCLQYENNRQKSFANLIISSLAHLSLEFHIIKVFPGGGGKVSKEA